MAFLRKVIFSLQTSVQRSVLTIKSRPVFSESYTSSLKFRVKRKEAVLVTPARRTPHEFKSLSDVDDQQSLRLQVSFLFFYKNNPMKIMRGGDDPVNIIRGALAEALVFYYPIAGRLRDGPNGKLIVECTAEGVLFVEADADVRLDEFGDQLQRPFPCEDELIHDDGRFASIVGTPLMLIQVTRLQCGGFIFGIRYNHTIADGPGLFQFLNAIAEMARDLSTPTVVPVWARELLTARDPPRITHSHPEFEALPNSEPSFCSKSLDDVMVHRSFFFGPEEISLLKNKIPCHLRSSSRFEVILACMWKCRAVALYSSPRQEVRVMFLVNGRGMKDSPLPVGYYGNAFAAAVAQSTVHELSTEPLSYVVEMVRKAKTSVTPIYMQSLADLMVLRRRMKCFMDKTYMVSDTKNIGFATLDFGWGEPLAHGVVKLPVIPGEGIPSFYVRYTKNGKDGIIVPMCLPKHAMERVAEEIEGMTT